MPHRVRSAGIDVDFFQAPFTYASKFAPGLAEVSIPAVSTPNVPIFGVGYDIGAVATGLDADG